ncbi:helix-turn-helix domain-containing protein [Bradyrhizobium sp. HKCCYLRH2015]|uniref:AraC family transcriptional regulator n=1 Tax=Bradyrhizobium TaxID=374 RepID=UPI0028E4EBB1|nr:MULTISPECIES: AraC family transcriptional regulator [unclassified Bradyrhizobium]
MLVHDETQWRAKPAPATLANGRHLQVGLSRWRSEHNGPIEVCSDCEDDSHVVTLVQRRARQELLISGRSVWSGGEEPNAMLITGPRQGRWRGVARGRLDNLRVFLSQDLLRECMNSVLGRLPSGDICLFETDRIVDDGLRQLALAFRAADLYDGIAGPSFVEGLALAFGSRLIERHHGRTISAGDAAKPAADRIGRALDYIDAHLGRTISLSQLSDIAGLPRSRFAAQFKAATGHPPHAYILHRRIVRAQERLRATEQPVVSIAFDLGFSSQAHFTTAFRRMTGNSPALWRLGARNRTS